MNVRNEPPVVFVGERDTNGRLEVFVDTNDPGAEFKHLNLRLHPRQDLYNHSPDGFECGYNGSGPAQLALGMLSAFFTDDDLGDQKALAIYQDFKAEVIAGLPQDENWRLPVSHIIQYLESPFPKEKLQSF